MTKSKRTLLIVAAALVVVVLLAAQGYALLKDRVSDTVTEDSTSVSSQTTNSENASSQTTETPAFSAPDFTVLSEDGSNVTLSSYAGKVIVINFWTTWCRYCVMEMSTYQTLYETYGDQVVFLMVDGTDGTHETMANAKEFKAGNDYTFPIFADEDNEARIAYGVSSYPTSIVISPEGKVVAHVQGIVSLPSMRNLIEGQLG